MESRRVGALLHKSSEPGRKGPIESEKVGGRNPPSQENFCKTPDGNRGVWKVCGRGGTNREGGRLLRLGP